MESTSPSTSPASSSESSSALSASSAVLVWQTRPVSEAVAASGAAPHKLFLVLLSDDGDRDSDLERALSSPDVIEFVSANAITVRVPPASVEAFQFRQIYPLETVPVLAVLREGSLRDSITAAHVRQLGGGGGGIVERLSACLVTQEVAMAPRLEEVAASSSAKVEEEELQQQQQQRRAQAAAELKEKRKQLAQKREEEERQKEMEREKRHREQGRLLSEASEARKDMEAKNLAADLQKAKKEEAESLRRIREQIALDKENRRKEREKRTAPPQASSSSSPEATSINMTNANSATISNLAIRQTDGTMLRNRFRGSDTLQTVKDFVDANRTDGDGPYTMMATFPYEQFSDLDMRRALADLGLTPSGTITLKPHKNIVSAYAGAAARSGSSTLATVGTFLWWIVEWVGRLGHRGYDFVGRALGFLPPAPSGSSSNYGSGSHSPSSSSSSTATTRKSGSDERGRIGRIADFSSEGSNARGRQGGGGGDNSDRDKKKGDDQAFYNGNSTEFL